MALRPLCLFLLGLAACASSTSGPYTWVRDLPKSAIAPTRIEPRDTLIVSVDGQPAMSGEFLVREDGCFLHQAGNLCVAGRTPDEASAHLATMLRTLVVNPRATLWVGRSAPIKVSIVGEVRTPGAYELTRDRSVLTALAAAGWITDYAHEDRVFVIRRAEPQQRVRFRLKDLTGADPASIGFRLKDGDTVVVE
jgi:polysaccharide export outer membrane protein